MPNAVLKMERNVWIEGQIRQNVSISSKVILFKKEQKKRLFDSLQKKKLLTERGNF